MDTKSIARVFAQELHKAGVNSVLNRPGRPSVTRVGLWPGPRARPILGRAKVGQW